MTAYKLKDGLDEAYIPGMGRVRKGVIVMGEYSKYVPSLLVEVPNSGYVSVSSPAPTTPLEATEPSRGPSVLTEPAPLQTSVVETEEDSKPQRLEEDQPKPKASGRPPRAPKVSG